MTPARELRLAVGIGLLGGVLLGAREGVVTLAANAFAEADRYAMAYLMPIRVLVVEDHAETAELIARHLRAAGAFDVADRKSVV